MNRAVIKSHFGPLVANLETALCKTLNSMVFGQSAKVLEIGLNIFARPNSIELKEFHRDGVLVII